MKHAFLILSASLALYQFVPAQMPSPSGLMCELMQHPELSVITDPKPEFGWIMNSDKTNQVQTAYQILIATSLKNISANTGDVWDSKKVASSNSINVEYAGPSLAENTKYLWKVRIWDKEGMASDFSEPQQFNTGSFSTPGSWPGESRWINLNNDNGITFYTFENRPPISYHQVAPVRIIKKSNRHYFVDFGKSAYATIKLYLPCISSQTGIIHDSITVIIGEKQHNDTVDAQPGGTLIYLKITVPLKASQDEYIVELPRFVPKYPHSQVMPLFMPEVAPFRYCEILNSPCEIETPNATQLALYSQFNDSAASFHCSNENLNKIYDLCHYSIKVNTFNGDYASSQRERMMYEIDTYMHLMGHYATDREYAVARYSYENMIYHTTWPTECIPHALFMAWADYMQTGNSDALITYYDDLKAKTLEFLEREDGLISTTAKTQTKEFLDKIHFNGEKIKDMVDWPPGSPYFTKVNLEKGGETDGYVFADYNTVINAFHYKSLLIMADIASALKKKNDALKYHQLAEKVKISFNKYFYDQKKGIYTDGIGTDHSSLHANMFALVFGLVEDQNKSSVIQFIKSKGMACSVYGAKYLVDAMFDAGETQYAIDLMTATHDRSWMNMINIGSTITTEAWDLKYKLNSSWTHAWSSSPVHIIPCKLMGIEPLEPGFRKIRISPQTGNLTAAETKLPSPVGTIYTAISNKDDAYTIKVVIPANCVAQVCVPDYGSRILVNGISPEKINGLKIISKNLNNVTFQIGSGNYEIKSLKK